jgi:hypothetical protein
MLFIKQVVWGWFWSSHVNERVVDAAYLNKNHSSKPEYQESHKNSSQKQYWSKKDVTWWSGPLFCMAEYSSHFITFNSNIISSWKMTYISYPQLIPRVFNWLLEWYSYSYKINICIHKIFIYKIKLWLQIWIQIQQNCPEDTSFEVKW